MNKIRYSIETEDLTKSFGKKSPPALRGVSLTIKQGESVALIGANGAGKTTLIRILSAILSPNEGTATICGFDVCREPEETKRRMGILFAGDALYDRLTGRENILYHAELRGIDPLKSGKSIQKLIDLLDMADFIDNPSSSYSRGMKQKTSIARSVIHNPPIMILDEPSTGLDIASGRAIRSFMKTCTKEGRTVVFSSHNSHEIEECAGRIVMIHEGRIVMDMGSRAFRKEFGGKIEDAYFRYTEGR
jgi:sodium transport system ATP-binding protein